jgi:hypothetical protein
MGGVPNDAYFRLVVPVQSYEDHPVSKMLINYLDYNLPGTWGSETFESTFFPDASDKPNLYNVDRSDTYEPSCALVAKYLYNNAADCRVRPSTVLW